MVHISSSSFSTCSVYSIQFIQFTFFKHNKFTLICFCCFFLVYRRIYGSRQISGERAPGLSDLKARRQLLAVCSITSLVVHSIEMTANRHLLVPADMVDEAEITAYECKSIIVSVISIDDNSLRWKLEKYYLRAAWNASAD